MTTLPKLTIQQARDMGAALFNAALYAQPASGWSDPITPEQIKAAVLGAIRAVYALEGMEKKRQPMIDQIVLSAQWRAGDRAKNGPNAKSWEALASILTRLSWIKWPGVRPDAIVFESLGKDGERSSVIYLGSSPHGPLELSPSMLAPVKLVALLEGGWEGKALEVWRHL